MLKETDEGLPLLLCGQDISLARDQRWTVGSSKDETLVGNPVLA